MSLLYRRKRRHRNTLKCLRFFLFPFLFVIVSSSFAQEADSLYHYRTSVAADYFDLFRQKAERASTTIFARHTLLSVSLSHLSDSLCLFAEEEKEYGSYDNHFSKFSVAGENTVQSGGISWSSRALFFAYSLTAGIQVNGIHYLPFGGAEIFTKPFGDFLTASFAWNRSPVRGLSAILFQDFAVTMAGDSPSNSWNFTVEGKPFEDINGGARLYEKHSRNVHSATGYAPDYSYDEFGKELFFTFTPADAWTLWGKLSISEQRGNLSFFRENQSFENMPGATGEQVGADAGITTTLFALPFAASYSYKKTTCDGVGDVESWPFTSLASSVISNRLNYHFNATITLHSLTVTPRILSSPAIEVETEYLFVIPNAYAEHWQPQFLVFGVKDYAKDYFTIERMHLLKIGAMGNFQILKMEVKISLEQYLPLIISYRTTPSITQPPVPVPQPSAHKPSTDGGRRITIVLSYNF